MEPKELLKLSDQMRDLAQAMERTAQTAEQWNAVENLKVVERNLFSAAAWLMRHADRFAPSEET